MHDSACAGEGGKTTWAGARAYCVWRGGDLPTEVQWEAAARGSDDRTYPWGYTAPGCRKIHTVLFRLSVTTDVSFRLRDTQRPL
ncbi:SUMF1/EgtB/PvdO family nonheme iron enzyme [Rhizobium leguminosarum]|uniref:SUMF1/EgtB/PvdO family nonheme iron enzyme n=1 Tax=Rhizobium leguminosarum TaxID=384 RepID=UPI001C95817F|nr:SUMF1/EgtB/PvdO family nonheme iron enzyme [Rhizobium leguminosarum]MBY5616655.1 formylglycine-generating enzyme family protein [Rhizobium leguminosarum]